MAQKDRSDLNFLRALLEGDLAETKVVLREYLGAESTTLSRAVEYFAMKYHVGLDLQTKRDLYVDVLVNVLKSKERLTEVRNLGGWLRSLARNTVADFQRKSIPIERSEISVYDEILDGNDAEHLRHELFGKHDTGDPRSLRLSYPDRITDLVATEEQLQQATHLMLLCLTRDQRLAGLLGLATETGRLAKEDATRLTGWTDKKLRDQKRRAWAKVKGWMKLIEAGHHIPLAKDTALDLRVSGYLRKTVYVDYNLSPQLHDESFKAIGLTANQTGPGRRSETEYVSGLGLHIDPYNPEIYYSDRPGGWLSLEIRKRQDHRDLKLALLFDNAFRFYNLNCELEFSPSGIWIPRSTESLHKVGETDGGEQHLLAFFDDLDLSIWG